MAIPVEQDSTADDEEAVDADLLATARALDADESEYRDAPSSNAGDDAGDDTEAKSDPTTEAARSANESNGRSGTAANGHHQGKSAPATSVSSGGRGRKVMTEEEREEARRRKRQQEEEEEDSEVHKQRATKLKFLLQRSGVYSKIMADKMEKERKARADAQAKESEASSATNGHRDDEGHSGSSKGTAKGVTIGRTTRAGDADEKKDASTAITRQKRSTAGKRKPDDNDWEVSKYITKEDLNGGSGTSTPEKRLKTQNKSASASASRTSTPLPFTRQSRQPALVTGAELRSYQIDGFEWLVGLYENGLNGILADEMGLGKTLQTIAFLAHLRGKGVWGPFLVVAPLSTIANWVNEFERFTPGIPVLMYHARGKPERAELRKHLTYPATPEEKKAFPVVVTSFEVAMMDRVHLSHLKWKYIVVDEGHRLKNMNCRLIQELKRFKSAQRLILTGTPLHNNLKELWSLLNFILPDIFDDLETFEKWFDFSDIHNEGGDNRLLSKEDSRSVITQLHSILKPFLLRRLKTDVESTLPPKKEYLLYAPLTGLQKELYEECVHGTIRRWLLEKKTGLPYAEIRRLLGDDDFSDDQEPNGLSGAASSKQEQVNGTSGPTAAAKAKRRSRGNNVKYAEDETDTEFADRIESMEDSDEEDVEEALSANDQEREGKLFAIRQAQKDIHNMKLQNLFMQLRKICCHPYLFDWPKQADGQMLVDKSLVTSSGKMLMLNRLLDALFAKKHKVLIFSQFTTILDIIEDWADEYKKIKTCRIDGTTSQEDRRLQMKSFNEDESVDSVKLFLLSTRAGGLGINLVAADTVIFYDSDWNPQMDLQAQDRVHRIGQKRPVLIFRLVSANTVESRLLKRAGDKRKLEAIVIKNGEFQLPAGVSGADLLNGSATGKGKQESMQDMARALMSLEGEKVRVAEEGDEIISDAQLEMLLDRSESAYKRQTGWSAAEASGKFEVTETNADAANEDLAKLMAES